MSVEIDGRSYAEIRVDRLRFQLTDRYALGTDISGAGNSWMAVYQLAILKHPLGPEQKEVLRRYAAARIAEIEANPDEKAIVFRGNQHLATAGHPSHNRSK